MAQIQGKPVYVITEVALTPLSSKVAAESAISQTQRGLLKRSVEDGADNSDTDSDDEDISADLSGDIDDEVIDAGPGTPLSSQSSQSLGEHKRTSSIAQDVIAKRGDYGRFAQKWFSRKGWTVGQRRNLGMSASETNDTVQTPTSLSSQNAEEGGQPPTVTETLTKLEEEKSPSRDVASTLLPKLLRTTKIMFGTSHSFFFSYDYDITRSVATRRVTNSDLPLYTEVDPLFFWNHHVIQPFIDAGQTPFVLPLMQGFVGQRLFEMDTNPPRPIIGMDGEEKTSMEMNDLSVGVQSPGGPDSAEQDSPKRKESREAGGNTIRPFLMTLISRRSVKRAGLRYLRRGIDEQGNTANGVETEQILSDPSWTSSSNIYSFIQIRGSVPIFFSQSPYSFKPVPQIHHSAGTNFQAFEKHFKNLSDRYGQIQVASLVEKHGPEAIVGDSYATNIERLNEMIGNNGYPIGFEWFDFHAVCRGMKFENVSLLMGSLASKLDEFGYTVESEGQLISKQSGVLRTNCMDCLDRTNIVQSACARRALEMQLKTEGIDMSLQVDQTTQWFNTLWADNGDAVSKQYASTAAMKGDFTRTRKRDFKGALNDMGLSISRFYSGYVVTMSSTPTILTILDSIVNDYFSQAAIDFLLGNVTVLVWEDFEANLMTGDPGVSMQKMRQQAIEVSQKLVVADEHEEFIGGWALLTPRLPNTFKSTTLEEAVLLLTDSALYAARFDWNMEKVISFERVELDHIKSLKYGPYITSTLSAAQADETRNVGFIITYEAGTNDVTRINTRSMSTSQDRDERDQSTNTPATPIASGLSGLIGRQPPQPASRILAWKALPSKSAVTAGQDGPSLSEIETVKSICTEIERLALQRRTEKTPIMEPGSIITREEARRSTGLFEQLGHQLKKMVWA